MPEENKYLNSIKSKYAKTIGIVALFISIFALAGIIGAYIIYLQSKTDNYKVNISGRQRFLSAMILIDLENHIKNKNNQSVISTLQNERRLLNFGMEVTEFNNPKVISGVKNSKFSIDNTPDSIDIHAVTKEFLNATDPTIPGLENRISSIIELQRQIIGPVWDIATTQMATQNDYLHFTLMIFVVFCFGLVIALNLFAIQKVVLPLMREIKQSIEAAEIAKKENVENKNLLKVSSKFVTIGEQVANINHDMNNMLAIISTFIPSFKTLIANQPEQLKKFSVLEKAVDRLMALTSALRRSILGQENTTEETFPLVDILHDCKTILNDKFKHHEVLFDFNVEDNLVIKIRRDSIYQLLLNLITNAVEAVSHSEHAWVVVDAEQTHDCIIIRVKDSGDGLSEEVKNKIFTPFFTTKESGSGLGLSYMKKMIEEIGGQLFYDDSFENTCFTLIIPKKTL